MNYGIAVDCDRCMACYNCFIACKDEHCGYSSNLSEKQPEIGQFWIDIKEWERGNKPGNIKVASVPLLCSHCNDADCIKASQKGAVYKREDGIVIIDPVKSKGQKKIVDACKAGVIFWNDELEIPQKCTMCAELLDQGWTSPRCVEACPNNALIFGDLDDPESEISKKINSKVITSLKALEGKKTNVHYFNIPKRFIGGSVYLPNDEVAIDANVTLTGQEGIRYNTKTNWAGDWIIDNLPEDLKCEVKIEFSGFKTYKFEIDLQNDNFIEHIMEKK